MRTISASLFLLPIIALGQAPPSPSVIVATPSDRDRARTFLNESLNDKNPDTRKHAVQALGLVGPREPYISQVESMLDDKDLEPRGGIAEGAAGRLDDVLVALFRVSLEESCPL